MPLSGPADGNGTEEPSEAVYGEAPWLHAHSYIPYLGCTRVYSIGVNKGESFRHIKIGIESIEIGKVRISLFV
jgi:hypothetical protein